MIQSLSGRIIVRFDVPEEDPKTPYQVSKTKKELNEAIAKKAFEFEQWLDTVITEKAYEEHKVGLRVHLNMSPQAEG